MKFHYRNSSNIQIRLQNTLNPIVQEQPVTPLFAYPDFSRTMLTQKHVLNGAKADVHVTRAIAQPRGHFYYFV